MNRTKTLGWLVGAAARKAVGGAMMVAVLAMGFSACASGDDSVTEEQPTPQQPTAQTATKIHVTVGAGISDGDGQTRSTVDYNAGKRTLKFTAGDRLYVRRSLASNWIVAGMLTVKEGTLAGDGLSATFEGDLTLYDEQGHVDSQLPSGDPQEESIARLVPEGMTENMHYTIAADTRLLTFVGGTNVAADVATLMTTGLTVQGNYTAGSGYTMHASDPILNCCIGGLVPETAYTFTLSGGSNSTTVGWTTDGQGTASFAFASPASGSQSWTLSVSQGQTAVGTISLGSGSMNLGAKVYNVNRYLFGGTFTKEIDLADVGSNLVVTNGLTLTGELSGNHKISIAPGATVTLSGVTIPRSTVINLSQLQWAGITCFGDATIVLAQGTTNYVKGYNSDYPGIQAGPENTTLTIRGAGTLTAETGISTPQGYAAGIGGGYNQTVGNIRIEGGTIIARGNIRGAGIGSGFAYDGTASCGDITITGGDITATGGVYAAGIGTGRASFERANSSTSCGDIEISGGTVKATGGISAAGIGTGSVYPGTYYSCTTSCGNITIGGTAKGTATGGDGSPNEIGAGYNGTCGTVSVDDGTISGFIPGTAACTFTVNYQNAGGGQAWVKASKIIVSCNGQDYEFTGEGGGNLTNGATAMGDLPHGYGLTLTFTAATTAQNSSTSTGTYTATKTVDITGETCDLGTVTLVKQ